ncbi:hypothetical protein BGW80DRAFT_1458697 [Lactifluus volemus]|nr:hypothetical protein BGW80DRAFT_1458697 [Lactifluus volemus]
MRFVKKHAPSIPIPDIYSSSYDMSVERVSEAIADSGELYMSFVPGRTAWAEFVRYGERTHLLRHLGSVPSTRPEHLSTDFDCTADGSPSRDPLLGSNSDRAPPFLDDKTFRDRIYERYVAHHGLTYRDGTRLPDLLPQSDTSVFTHGYIGPRNIMVDANGHILGLLD